VSPPLGLRKKWEKCGNGGKEEKEWAKRERAKGKRLNRKTERESWQVVEVFIKFYMVLYYSRILSVLIT